MGFYYDIITEDSARAKQVAKSRVGIKNLFKLYKQLPSDMKSISKRPNTNPLKTGDFESLRDWMLQMVKDAKDEDRCDYLRKDAYVAIHQLETLEKNMRDVKNGTPSRYVAVKVVQKQMDSGCTPDKVHKHIQWIKSTYLPAITKRKKELRDERKKKLRESTIDFI